MIIFYLSFLEYMFDEVKVFISVVNLFIPYPQKVFEALNDWFIRTIVTIVNDTSAYKNVESLSYPILKPSQRTDDVTVSQHLTIKSF